jgi:hypothetical protein
MQLAVLLQVELENSALLSTWIANDALAPLHDRIAV